MKGYEKCGFQHSICFGSFHGFLDGFFDGFFHDWRKIILEATSYKAICNTFVAVHGVIDFSRYELYTPKQDESNIFCFEGRRRRKMRKGVALSQTLLPS